LGPRRRRALHVATTLVRREGAQIVCGNRFARGPIEKYHANEDLNWGQEKRGRHSYHGLELGKRHAGRDSGGS